MDPVTLALTVAGAYGVYRLVSTKPAEKPVAEAEKPAAAPAVVAPASAVVPASAVAPAPVAPAPRVVVPASAPAPRADVPAPAAIPFKPPHRETADEKWNREHAAADEAQRRRSDALQRARFHDEPTGIPSGSDAIRQQIETYRASPEGKAAAAAEATARMQAALDAAAKSREALAAKLSPGKAYKIEVEGSTGLRGASPLRSDVATLEKIR